VHLQQTLPLLCSKPYKHPKTTNLNLNTIKEEGDNMLPRRFLLFLRHRKEGNDSLLSLPSLFQ
jgi:hypothetical protein